MKKYLKILIPILFIGAFCYFGYHIYSKIQHKKKVAENIKTIPTFEYQNINGKIFTNKDLKKNIPTLFIYYNSECDFCNEEAQMIKKNIAKFTNFQLCFISFEEHNQIKSFATKYQLNIYDNVHFLCDNKITFASTFDVKSMPCLVLYNKDQKLIEKIKGQVKTETILKKLEVKN